VWTPEKSLSHPQDLFLLCSQGFAGDQGAQLDCCAGGFGALFDVEKVFFRSLCYPLSRSLVNAE
jgi:hypothetical protein